MHSSTLTESRTFRAAPTQAPACCTISPGVSPRKPLHVIPSRLASPFILPFARANPIQFPLRIHARCLHSSMMILFPHPRFLILIPFRWLLHTFPLCQRRALLSGFMLYPVCFTSGAPPLPSLQPGGRPQLLFSNTILKPPVLLTQVVKHLPLAITIPMHQHRLFARVLQ